MAGSNEGPAHTVSSAIQGWAGLPPAINRMEIVKRENGLMRKLALAAACSTLIVSQSASALGLGKIATHSYLNQPLEADISLLSLTAEERDSLEVRLAGPEAYEKAGIPRPQLLNRVDVGLREGPGGQPVIALRSDRPIVEPFVSFLVEVEWAEGRLLREYTVLLDPPTLVPEEKPDVQAPASEGGQGGTADRYGPVTGRDSLWAIARQTRPGSDIGIHQMMIALQRANPDAFIDGNVNLLREGVTLEVPDRATIEAIDAAEAQAEFRRQTEAWEAGRAGAEAPAGPEAAGTAPAGEPATGDAEGPATADAATPEASDTVPEGEGEQPAEEPGEKVATDDELRIVAPEGEAGEAGEGAATDQATRAEIGALQEELTMVRELAEARRAENERLNERLGRLEEQLSRMERLIELKDDELAELQEALREQAAAPTPAPTAPAESPQETAPTGAMALLMNPVVTAALGAGVVALLFLGLLARRRGGEEPAEVVAAPRPEPVAEEGSRGAAPAAESVSEPDAAVDEAPPAEGEAEVLDEAEVMLAYGLNERAVQLLDEAIAEEPDNLDYRAKLLEVLHRDGNTERFLTEARAFGELPGATGSRAWQRITEMGRELLPGESLFAGESAGEAESDVDAAMESGAEALGVELPDMEKPASREERPEEETPVEPAASEGVEEPTAPAEGRRDYDISELENLDFGELEREVGGEPPSAGETTEEASSVEDLGLGFEEPQAETPVEPAGLAGPEDTAGEVPEAPETEAVEPAETSVDEGLELEAAELEMPEPEESREAAPAATPEGAEFGESLELSEAEETEPRAEDRAGEDEGGMSLGADELDTKLDLARAFIDMGDAEGARATLQEVIDGGDASHREQAEALLKRLD